MFKAVMLAAIVLLAACNEGPTAPMEPAECHELTVEIDVLSFAGDDLTNELTIWKLAGASCEIKAVKTIVWQGFILSQKVYDCTICEDNVPLMQ